MKIKFLTDFRGRETNEVFYTAGAVVEFDDETAAQLINDKRAEKVEEYATTDGLQADANPLGNKRKRRG